MEALSDRVCSMLQVEDIVQSPTGTVGSIAAIDIADNLYKKMSKNDAERLVEKLEKDKWIGKVLHDFQRFHFNGLHHRYVRSYRFAHGSCLHSSQNWGNSNLKMAGRLSFKM